MQLGLWNTLGKASGLGVSIFIYLQNKASFFCFSSESQTVTSVKWVFLHTVEVLQDEEYQGSLSEELSPFQESLIIKNFPEFLTLMLPRKSDLQISYSYWHIWLFNWQFILKCKVSTLSRKSLFTHTIQQSQDLKSHTHWNLTRKLSF